MRTKKPDITKGNAVIAIAQEGNKYKAVCLSKKGSTLKLVWGKSRDIELSDWSSFIAECGLVAAERGNKSSGRKHNNKLVVGFDSIGVVFYRLKIPAVKEDEIDRIVRLQTEAKLPLPVEQIEMAYRTDQIKNGQTSVTVAAAKRGHLERFVEDIGQMEPAGIMLDCEGLVKTWFSLFSEKDRSGSAVIVNIGNRSTKVCLVEAGKLSNAAIIDMGAEDVSEQVNSSMDVPVAERFARDIQSVLGLFGFKGAGDVPVYFLVKGVGNSGVEEGISEFEVIKSVISILGSSGTEAKVCDFRYPVSSYLLSVEDNDFLYEYRLPIGLGLMALEEDKELDLFANVYSPPGMAEKKHWLYSLKAASVVTGVMLLITIAAFYFLDTAHLRHLNELKSQIDFGRIVGKKSFMEAVAEHRPDLLELLSELSSVEAKGIMLSGINFKLGQPVKIEGTAQNNEQFYKFQEDLSVQKYFKEVNIGNAQVDEKSKKVNFSLTFKYKNFSEKKI